MYDLCLVRLEVSVPNFCEDFLWRNCWQFGLEMICPGLSASRSTVLAVFLKEKFPKSKLAGPWDCDTSAVWMRQWPMAAGGNPIWKFESSIGSKQIYPPILWSSALWIQRLSMVCSYVPMMCGFFFQGQICPNKMVIRFFLPWMRVCAHLGWDRHWSSWRLSSVQYWKAVKDKSSWLILWRWGKQWDGLKKKAPYAMFCFGWMEIIKSKSIPFVTSNSWHQTKSLGSLKTQILDIMMTYNLPSCSGTLCGPGLMTQPLTKICLVPAKDRVKCCRWSFQGARISFLSDKFQAYDFPTVQYLNSKKSTT